MHARVGPSLYEQLEALPEGLIGEILDGQMYTQPRPSDKVSVAPFEATVIDLSVLWEDGSPRLG